MKPWDKIFANRQTETLTENSVVNVLIDEIERSPYQPRQEFEDMELRDLARSIQEVGLIQPVVVRKTPDGYQLIAGERRLRASKLAGYREIKAVVIQLDDSEAAAAGLIENIQRKDLNYFEEAMAYARMIGEFGLTQDEVATQVGKSQSAIANKLRLLKLSEEVRAGIAPDIVTERHSRALLKIENEEDQLRVLKEIYEKELTVKDTEQLVEKMLHGISREMKKPVEKKNITAIVKDARIYLNTIKETIFQAKESGVQILVMEKDTDDELELIIKIPKVKKGSGGRPKKQTVKEIEKELPETEEVELVDDEML
ncbi:MAG: ParB/RepB/Spo0J family partition protein [Acidobacteriota bacterium]